MSGIVVYKACFRPEGDTDYDRLYPPACGPSAARWVVFMDVPVPTMRDGWEILPAPLWWPDNRRRARMHKCLSHILFPDAEWTLWLDGTLTPRTTPEELIRIHAKPGVDFYAFDRRARRCAYQEGSRMALKGRDDPAVIGQQMRRMEKAGFPAGAGLCATTAVLRRQTGQEIERLNEAWWQEIKNWSNRDQVSINFCLWRIGMKWGKLRGRWNQSEDFDWRPHYH
jgi:hypothetical protein